MIALLTITPVGQGKTLKYFYEYKTDNSGEVGVAEDGREMQLIKQRFEALSKENKIEMIVKTLPIQKEATVIIDAVAESVSEPIKCDPETGEILE